jgi:mRNA-degrading endonuclease RelE of RelBE toxin-antitoxin system
MNKINWQTKALKQMRKLPAAAGSAIRTAVRAELIDLSAARNVKKLTNHDFGYRLRVSATTGCFSSSTVPSASSPLKK